VLATIRKDEEAINVLSPLSDVIVQTVNANEKDVLRIRCLAKRDLAKSQFGLGQNHISRKTMEEAQLLFQRLAELDPSEYSELVDTTRFIGEILSRQDDFKGAEREFDKALQLCRQCPQNTSVMRVPIIKCVLALTRSRALELAECENFCNEARAVLSRQKAPFYRNILSKVEWLRLLCLRAGQKWEEFINYSTEVCYPSDVPKAVKIACFASLLAGGPSDFVLLSTDLYLAALRLGCENFGHQPWHAKKLLQILKYNEAVLDEFYNNGDYNSGFGHVDALLAIVAKCDELKLTVVANAENPWSVKVLDENEQNMFFTDLPSTSKSSPEHLFNDEASERYCSYVGKRRI
jgi:tetratricopeptide (TPR) repeat protein